MGTMKNKKLEEHDERARRRRANASSRGPADWAYCDAGVLLKAIAAVAASGGALRLGYTRDLGAYSIGIYGDGAPFTEYVRPDEDITQYMRGVAEDYE